MTAPRKYDRNDAIHDALDCANAVENGAHRVTLAILDMQKAGTVDQHDALYEQLVDLNARVTRLVLRVGALKEHERWAK